MEGILGQKSIKKKKTGMVGIWTSGRVYIRKPSRTTLTVFILAKNYPAFSYAPKPPFTQFAAKLTGQNLLNIFFSPKYIIDKNNVLSTYILTHMENFITDLFFSFNLEFLIFFSYLNEDYM